MMALSMTARLLICCAFVRFFCRAILILILVFSFGIIAIGGDCWAIWAG
jgi:hypothetical protein